MNPERRLQQDMHRREHYRHRRKPCPENGSLTRRTPHGAPTWSRVNRKPLRSNRGYLSRYYAPIISLAFDKSQKVTRTLPGSLRLIGEECPDDGSCLAKRVAHVGLTSISELGVQLE